MPHFASASLMRLRRALREAPAADLAVAGFHAAVIGSGDAGALKLRRIPGRRRLRLRPASAQCLILACLFGIGAATASPDQVPPEGWRLAFQDKFESLNLWDRTGGTWQPTYPSGARTNAANRERQYYVDPREGRDAPALREPSPFRIDANGLAIVARTIPSGVQPPFPGAAYLSGILTSARSFSFRYGYTEIEAKVPRGKGLWPGFWMLPVGGGWPPEIDVLEVLGGDTDGYWATLHSGARRPDEEIQGRVRAADLSRDFHTYGMLWKADEISWYLDGRKVFSAPTPSDFHVPMYLLIQLAVAGGGWAGAPTKDTPFPSEFRIRRVSVHLPPEATPGGSPQ